MALRILCQQVHHHLSRSMGLLGARHRGALAGRRLARLPCLKDYWFDWKTYNPNARVFTAGLPPGP